eukprot:scaffold1085_cov407-Prasinococcus_capsulatus_cf.AAC.97
MSQGSLLNLHMDPEIGQDEGSQGIYESERERARFEAFSTLQSYAATWGENLEIPEIVAIGGQSDGKSTLLEALLGFRFNVRDVEMGTRRPLVLQMKTCEEAEEPRCALQEEDSDEYGEPILPAASVAEVIRQRTEDLLAKTGQAVSSKPIVMRAEYKYSPNLTIVDTPGLIIKSRNGEPENTPDVIKNMVKEQIAPSNRLILFLQQSTVEWASSVWFDIVKEVDPRLQRTVFVASKFDNRLKEFSERWEVDQYLSASGYLGSCSPFFVALPKDRHITGNEHFRRLISDTDTLIWKKMREDIRGGFNETKYGERVGFRQLRDFLVAELARRYKEAAPSTLANLHAKCLMLEEEVSQLHEAVVQAKDVASLRKQSLVYSSKLCQRVLRLLEGNVEPDEQKFGMSVEEEAALMPGSKGWPGAEDAHMLEVDSSHMRLYGGAAFERLLEEMEEAMSLLTFKEISDDKVTNLLLGRGIRGAIDAGDAGAKEAGYGIARTQARLALAPIMDYACERVALILRRLFVIADESMRSTTERRSTENYLAFHAALQRSYDLFVQKLAKECKRNLSQQIMAITSEFACLPPLAEESLTRDYMTSSQDLQTTISPQLDARSERVPLRDSDQNTENKEPSQVVAETPPSVAAKYFDVTGPTTKGTLKRSAYDGDPGRYLRANAGAQKKRRNSLVCESGAQYFAHIRSIVAKQIAPCALRTCFLTPYYDSLHQEISIALFAKTDEEFSKLFTAAATLENLESRRDALDAPTGHTPLEVFNEYERNMGKPGCKSVQRPPASDLPEGPAPPHLQIVGVKRQCLLAPIRPMDDEAGTLRT